MPSVYLWHIDSVEPVATITTQAADWVSPQPVTIFRATHIPFDNDGNPIDHPFRRTSLNVWLRDLPLPQFPEDFARTIYEQCGDDPLWIGLFLCCKRPSFWLDADILDASGNEILPEEGPGAS